jgi:putative ABC transport system permease protein
MFKIAFRNVWRNGRRSLMTASAIAVGVVALILFGEYNGTARIGIETGLVESSGHLSVFKQGYFEFGSARPLDYSISGYETLIALIENDAQMKPMLSVVTPTVSLGGIAGNARLDQSKTFFASGFVPSERDRMLRWDEYGLASGDDFHKTGLSDAVVDHGVVGTGLARILGLCQPLKLGNCTAFPQPAAHAVVDEPVAAGEKSPRLDLLSGGGGAPNIAAFYVGEARSLGAKELDDSYIGMHLKLAQRLLYGADDRKVSSIVIQLKRTEDIAPARARLNALFAAHHLDLEVRDFRELSPSFSQIMNFFGAMFAFLAVILGIIVIFTVVNTMGMSVMERTAEIGTARALGVQRGAIRRQFLLEGAILGVFGASAGVGLGFLATWWINHADITYTPPGNAHAIQLYLLSHHNEGLIVTVWLVLAVMAVLASIVPANRAAKMQVVDALRHE